ncbi:MAG: preprotein translocase subunit SecG [Patescibacteria group bacterium]|nr:preprotein translocase subunit SecG [Patescibacteria group bacterium]
MQLNIIYILQIVLAILLGTLILLQAKGTGLGSTFGGELSFYRTKRGVEKLLFYLTIIVSSLFLIISVVALIL